MENTCAFVKQCPINSLFALCLSGICYLGLCLSGLVFGGLRIVSLCLTSLILLVFPFDWFVFISVQ